MNSEWLINYCTLPKILLGAAINDEVERFQIFDWTQSLLELSHEVYDFEEANFKETILDYYNHEIDNPNIFLH